MIDRLTVKAAFRNGGKALIHLEDGATNESAAREVRAYLDRGATTVVVERRGSPPHHVVLEPQEAQAFIADIARQLDHDAPVGSTTPATNAALARLDAEALDLIDAGADLEGSDAGEGVAAHPASDGPAGR